MEPRARTLPRYRPLLMEGLRWALMSLFALLISLLPNIRSGTDYLADGDELLYRVWSRDIVLKGSFSLVDGVHKDSGPMMHPWLLFAPPAWLCRELGIGLRSIGILWRTLAGLGIVAGLYVIARTVLKGPWLATALAICLVCDAGMLFGQPGGRGLVIASTLIRGSNIYFDGEPYVMGHLRVVTPGLALPLLLVHFAGVLQARRGNGRLTTLAASLSFGLLFHVYFYFWTAALGTVLAAIVVDPAGRRLYFKVLLGGLILGGPVILSGMLIKSATPPDWLSRTDKFVPIDRLSELIIPWKVMALWLATTPWVYLKRRELAYVWCFVAAGFGGLNSQVFTCRQFENFHWLMALGVAHTTLLVCLIAPLVEHRLAGKWRWLFGLLVVFEVGLGLVLRDLEGERTAETRYWAELRREIDREGFEYPPGSVLAGEVRLALLVAGDGDIYTLMSRLVEYSAKADDTELDERLILNLYLIGIPQDEAESMVMGSPGTLSREAHAQRDPIVARTQRDRRLKLIEQIYPDPLALINTYAVDLVIIEREASDAHLESLGHKVKQGTRWNLWRLDRETMRSIEE